MRRRTTRQILVLMALLMPGAAPAQEGGDEVSSFFRAGRPEPVESQVAEINRLWRKLVIGTRTERQEVRERLMDFGPVVLGRLEDELLHDNAEEGRAAALILGRIGDRNSLAILRDAAFGKQKKKIETHRRHVYMAIGLLGDEGDEKALLGLLPGLRRDEEQRAVIWALARLGGEASVQALGKLWSQEKDQRLRAAILLALGRIRRPEAWKLVHEGLQNGKESIRRAAVLAAADLRDPGHFDELRKSLKDGDTDCVRYALLGLALREYPKAVEVIAPFLRESDERLRALAVRALAAQGGEEALEQILTRADPRSERDASVQIAAAFALARFSGQAPEQATRRLLASDDARVARAALLAGIGSPQSGLVVLPELIRRSTDDDLVLTALELLAHADAGAFAEVLTELEARGDVKKKILERGAEIRGVLAEGVEGGHAILRGRIQVMIDELGGAPEWNLIAAIQEEIRRVERIDGPIENRAATGTRPDGSARPPEVWTRENEDLRIWFDRFPYHDRRQGWQVP